MTQDEIIEIAAKAGMRANPGHDTADGKHWPAVAALSSSVPREWLERFAALVAAKEREACAQVCEQAINSIWDYAPEDVQRTGRNVCTNLANAIRARSTQ